MQKLFSWQDNLLKLVVKYEKIRIKKILKKKEKKEENNRKRQSVERKGLGLNQSAITLTTIYFRGIWQDYKFTLC